jgi:hypothetical protein
MKLTGAAILVSRGIKLLQAAPAAYPFRSAAEDVRVAKKRKPQPGPALPPGPPLPATVAEAVAFLQARTAPDIVAEIRLPRSTT